tara:strand:- start:133 stop:3477 length:3345 start_codon:yes stop_codon:yes gene_type:complete
MLKAYNQLDELDKNTLASDDEFIADAVTFLENRGGLSGKMTREEVYENFMEHMRYHDVNEVTTIRDLEYAQNASGEDKRGFARLIDAYDKVNDTDTGRMLGDYAMGLATAPSTYLGLLSGMTGKAAAVAGTQAAKLSIRKALASAMKSGAKAAVMGPGLPGKLKYASPLLSEAGIGAVQGLAQSGTRVSTGQEDEFKFSRAITNAAAAGVGGAAIAGAGSLVGTVAQAGTNIALAKYARETAKTPEEYQEILRRGVVGLTAEQRTVNANELLEAARLGAAKKAKVAAEKSKEILKNADKEKVKKIKAKLNELDPAQVAEGRRLKKDLNPSDTLEGALGSEVIDNIAAAAYRVSDVLELKEGDRITTALHRAMTEGKLQALGINKILREHNLNYDQFSLVYLAEVSEAGRTLGIQGKLSQALKKKYRVVGELADPEMQPMHNLLNSLDDLNVNGVSSVTREQAEDAVGDSQVLLQYLRDFDKSGIGAMTLQPATTMRNTMGGGFRLAFDATTRTMDNLLVKASGNSPSGNSRGIFDGSLDTVRYMFNPQESRVIRTLFEENMPEEAKLLFREAGDLAARTDGESNLAHISRKVQVLNTASDNMFKQGMLAASLKRRLADQGEDLYDIIRKGEFGDIDVEVYQEAIKDAYEFTYQASMKGKDPFSSFARGVIRQSNSTPFVISAFMPFPRFVANQIKFQYQHMPVIGMLDIVAGKVAPSIIGNRAAKEVFRERLPKQMAGALALVAAYNWRSQQGDGAEWYEIHKGGDDYIDARAVYGPMSTFMVVADILYRMSSNTMSDLPQKPFQYYTKAFAQATLGSTLRTGLAISALDKGLADTFLDKGAEKLAGESIGNFLSRWSIPAGALKDMYGQADRDARLIPTTATGDENFLDYVYKKVTRNLPDIPLSTLTGGIIERNYDQSAVSPLMTGPLIAINPIEKQLFGATTIRKNALTKEMSRLGMEYRDMYRRDGDDKIDFYTRQELSRQNSNVNLNERLRAIIKTDSYRIKTRSAKVAMLREAATDVVNEAKKIAKLRLVQQAKRRGLPYSRVDLAEWKASSTTDVNQVNELYQSYPGNEGRTVGKDKDLFFFIGDKKYNVMQWAVSRGLPYVKASKL